MSRQLKPQTPELKPYLEIRIGTFCITAERIPVRLLATVSSAVTGIATWWMTR